MPYTKNSDIRHRQPTKYINIQAQQIRSQAERSGDGMPRLHLVTTISRLPNHFDKKMILNVMKKKWGCAGTIIMDTECDETIQLQGDWRLQALEFMADPKGLELSRDLILIHETVRLAK